jgi:hypothetical protein
MPYKDPKSEKSIESARLARRKHYQNNKEQYIKRNKESLAKMREHLNLVKSVPCMDCNQTYPPYVMDLDHRVREDKADFINVIMRRGSWKNFLDEIEKCDVVCSNCHRERTWNS